MFAFGSGIIVIVFEVAVTFSILARSFSETIFTFTDDLQPKSLSKYTIHSPSALISTD